MDATLYCSCCRGATTEREELAYHATRDDWIRYVQHDEGEQVVYPYRKLSASSRCILGYKKGTGPKVWSCRVGRELLAAQKTRYQCDEGIGVVH